MQLIFFNLYCFYIYILYFSDTNHKKHKMKSNYLLKTLLLFILITGSLPLFAQYPAGSPVAINGKLKVTGKNLQNECGTNVQLRGMSSHGLSWYETCYTTSALDALAGASWGIDIFRLALYVTNANPSASPPTPETGYINAATQTKWKMFIDNMVDECGKRGIYCMIDWHIIGDPNAQITQAREFWTYMAKKHTGKKHVLFEICNEPNGVTWAQVTTYANDIINNCIRNNDPGNTVILVGTPSWSSRPDQASAAPLSQVNIAYSLHFYAGESAHDAYRAYGLTALNANCAVFATEFGTSPASGTGTINTTNTGTWITWMKTNMVSWCNWTFSDAPETSAGLIAGSCGTSSWTNFTPSGTYISGQTKTADGFTTCAGNIVPPTITITAPADNTSFTQPTNITFTATTVVLTGGLAVSSVNFYATDALNVTTLIGTATGTSPYSITWTNAPLGQYVVKAIARTSNTAVTSISSGVHIFVNVPEAPYLGTAWPIPGIVQAEDYDIGGMMNAYYDNTAGNSGASTYRTGDDVDLEVCTDAGAGASVGFVAAGEWLKYMVNVTATNTYNIRVRLASGTTAAKSMRIEMDGAAFSGVFAAPSTGGYQTWQDVTISNLPLTVGPKVMRVFFVTGDINYNYVEFTAANVLPTVAITAPANNASYTAPATIALTATATDNGSITKLEFFQAQGTGAATSIGVSTSTTSPYSFSWTNVAAGTYTVTARATDNTGGIAVSAPITIVVNTVTGLSSSTSSDGLAGTLYPNPSNGSFALKGNEEIKSLYILNMYGAQVSSKENVRTGETFDLGTDLGAGTYIMHVQYATGKTQVFKLIKTQ